MLADNIGRFAISWITYYLSCQCFQTKICDTFGSNTDGHNCIPTARPIQKDFAAGHYNCCHLASVFDTQSINLSLPWQHFSCVLSSSTISFYFEVLDHMMQNSILNKPTNRKIMRELRDAT